MTTVSAFTVAAAQEPDARKTALEPPRPRFSAALAQFGEWLRRNQKLIQRVQWGVVLAYLALVSVPAFLPMPERAAHLWTNFTLFAQFAFWGLWWPFVLISMVLVGRAWCGIFCPEGALTEMAARHSRGLSVPRWLTWKGWPFVAFVLTTVYGQMISVYQYPKPALLILGGSTAGAIAVGWLYGRNKRVWCRYLCPVSGVFGLLAKLAPIHFRVDAAAWTRSRHAHNAGVTPVNCAPLVPLRTMKGNHDCHMCGRCSGFRDAIELRRSPNHEIVEVAGAAPKPVETLLIVFGLMGVATGAFHWSAEPLVHRRQAGFGDMAYRWRPTLASAAERALVDLHQLSRRQRPTDPARRRRPVFYIAATALVIGALVYACLYAATRCLGPWSAARFIISRRASSRSPPAACSSA